MAETKNKRTNAVKVEEISAMDSDYSPIGPGTESEPDQPTGIDWNEKVPYRLFRDSGKYSEPVFVSVNGKTFLIPRGKTVMIPRYVAQVLEDSASLKAEAAMKADRLEDEFINESAARNITTTY